MKWAYCKQFRCWVAKLPETSLLDFLIARRLRGEWELLRSHEGREYTTGMFETLTQAKTYSDEFEKVGRTIAGL